jgi:hypothetical protein
MGIYDGQIQRGPSGPFPGAPPPPLGIGNTRPSAGVHDLLGQLEVQLDGLAKAVHEAYARYETVLNPSGPTGGNVQSAPAPSPSVTGKINELMDKARYLSARLEEFVARCAL